MSRIWRGSCFGVGGCWGFGGAGWVSGGIVGSGLGDARAIRLVCLWSFTCVWARLGGGRGFGWGYGFRLVVNWIVYSMISVIFGES